MNKKLIRKIAIKFNLKIMKIIIKQIYYKKLNNHHKRFMK